MLLPVNGEASYVAQSILSVIFISWLRNNPKVLKMRAKVSGCFSMFVGVRKDMLLFAYSER